jgi:hypothetical protein
VRRSPQRAWSNPSPTRSLICPTGSAAIALSSPFCKNISLPDCPKSTLQPRPSHPTRGAYRDRHGRGVGCGGRGSARAHDVIAGRGSPVSDQAARRRTVLMRTAKSCGPDASTPASSLRRLVGPTGRGQNLNPQATVTNKPDHRGEREVSR